ncbi:MAG: alpha/beta hydrolase, partial [Gammaproteobacteria bacterium]|nr:alpha/beta hydrolase [Gammaproteobacteria bacterium]
VRKLGKLVICNVPHPQAMNQAFSWAQLKKSWYILFFQIPALPEKLFARNDGAGIADVMRNSAVDKSRFPQEVGEVYRSNAMQPGTLTAMINYYRALVRGGGAKRQRDLGFPIIETPTLMVWGEDDMALTKETTYGTEDYVRDFTIRYLPKVSHWVQQEQPEVVNAMISAFLNGEAVPELEWEAKLVTSE